MCIHLLDSRSIGNDVINYSRLILVIAFLVFEDY